jgi:hypothetical protein
MDMDLELGSYLGGSSSNSRSSLNKYATYNKYEEDERDSSYSRYDDDDAKSVVSSLFADVFGKSSRTERYPSRTAPTQSKEINNLHGLLSNEADDDLESIMARLSSRSGIERHMKEKEETAEKAAKAEEERIQKEAYEKIQEA